MIGRHYPSCNFSKRKFIYWTFKSFRRYVTYTRVWFVTVYEYLQRCFLPYRGKKQKYFHKSAKRIPPSDPVCVCLWCLIRNILLTLDVENNFICITTRTRNTWLMNAYRISVSRGFRYVAKTVGIHQFSLVRTLLCKGQTLRCCTRIWTHRSKI